MPIHARARPLLVLDFGERITVIAFDALNSSPRGIAIGIASASPERSVTDAVATGTGGGTTGATIVSTPAPITVCERGVGRGVDGIGGGGTGAVVLSSSA